MMRVLCIDYQIKLEIQRPRNSPSVFWEHPECTERKLLKQHNLEHEIKVEIPISVLVNRSCTADWDKGCCERPDNLLKYSAAEDTREGKDIIKMFIMVIIEINLKKSAPTTQAS